jgi:hypothetical protein
MADFHRPCEPALIIVSNIFIMDFENIYRKTELF